MIRKLFLFYFSGGREMVGKGKNAYLKHTGRRFCYQVISKNSAVIFLFR